MAVQDFTLLPRALVLMRLQQRWDNIPQVSGFNLERCMLVQEDCGAGHGH